MYQPIFTTLVLIEWNALKGITMFHFLLCCVLNVMGIWFAKVFLYSYSTRCSKSWFQVFQILSCVLFQLLIISHPAAPRSNYFFSSPRGFRSGCHEDICKQQLCDAAYRFGFTLQILSYALVFFPFHFVFSVCLEHVCSISYMYLKNLWLAMMVLYYFYE